MSGFDGGSLLDFLGAPVLVGDPVGRVVYVNRAFEAAFRCHRDELSGEQLAAVFSGGAREAVLKAVAEVCAQGRPSDLRLREEGQGYLGRVSPIETGADRVGVVILLTEEPEVDERLLTFHREIDEPLAEATGVLEELLEQTGGRRAKRYRGLAERGLSALQRAGKWSAELHGLLTGERRSTVAETSLDPNRVLRDVRLRVSDDFEHARVELDVLSRPQLPATQGDGELLQTALVRLLLHRLASARPGSAVTLSARRVGSGKQTALLIAVVDPLPAGREGSSDFAPEPRSVRENVSVIGGRMKTFVDSIAGRATVITLPLQGS